MASAAGGAAQGFAWINERPDATDAKAQKWGYVATAPGARLEFTIDTRIASSQEDYNRVVLTYLASYDGMGVAHVECTQVSGAVHEGRWGAQGEGQYSSACAPAWHRTDRTARAPCSCSRAARASRATLTHCGRRRLPCS